MPALKRLPLRSNTISELKKERLFHTVSLFLCLVIGFLITVDVVFLTVAYEVNNVADKTYLNYPLQ